MPVTPGDSIFYADGTTPASLADITSAMATSVQAALDLREGHSFSWANNTEKSAQAGMAIGDIGYQADNDTFYIYNGAAWKIWAKESTAYTPTFTNFVASASNFQYSITGGVAQVFGKATYSSGASTSNAITLTVPSGYNIDTTSLGAVRSAIIGSGGVDDASTTTDYSIQVGVASSTSVSLFANSYNGAATGVAYLTLVNTTSSIPLSWASGDVFYVNFSYPVA